MLLRFETQRFILQHQTAIPTEVVDQNAYVVKLQRMSLHHPCPLHHAEPLVSLGESGLGGIEERGSQGMQWGRAALGGGERLGSVKKNFIWVCLLSWRLNSEAGRRALLMACTGCWLTPVRSHC